MDTHVSSTSVSIINSSKWKFDHCFFVGNLNNESIFPQYHKHQLLNNFLPLDSVSCAKLQALRKGKCETDFVSGFLLKFG